MWEALFDIITCNMFNRKMLHFSENALALWSNLYQIDNKLLNDLRIFPNISDGEIDIKIIKGPIFWITSQKISKLPEHVGQYISAYTRQTLDPVELQQILSITENGKNLYPELKQLFPSSAKPRLNLT